MSDQTAPNTESTEAVKPKRNTTERQRQRRYQKQLQETLRVLMDNVTSTKETTNNLSSQLEKFEVFFKKSDDLLLENNRLLKELVNQNKVVTPTNVVTKDDKETQEQEKTLVFDLEKAKALTAELKAQGMTGKEIVAELTRQGYGNKRGKPFSKSLINKWLKKKN